MTGRHGFELVRGFDGIAPFPPLLPVQGQTNEVPRPQKVQALAAER